MKRISIAALAASACLCAFGYGVALAQTEPLPAVTSELSNGVTRLPGIVYRTLPGYRPLTLDLYRPAGGNEPYPLVVFLHGGGWSGGSPAARAVAPTVMIPELAAEGYVVAAVSYRLSGEAQFPAAFEDVQAALRYLREHADEFRIDPEKVAVWGESAGGHLAAFAGTACGSVTFSAAENESEFSSCVQAVVAERAPLDFAVLEEQAPTPTDSPTPPHTAPDSAESLYMGCTIPECDPGLLRSANPMTYVDKSDPPFLIVHGAADTAVSPQQSQALFDLLQEHEVEAELILLPNAGHTNYPGASAEDLDALRARMIAFLQDTLGT